MDLKQITENLSDEELWVHAHEMVNQHGFDAPMQAAIKADALFEEGDSNGSREWVTIVRHINELLRGPSERVN